MSTVNSGILLAVLSASGTHTLKVRVTGTKDTLSSGYWVPADRIDVNPTMSCILPSYHATGGYEPTQGTYDWTADSAQRKVAQGAQSYGANLIEAVSYSPPYWMTVSGTSQGGSNGGPNLASTYSGSGSGTFADYLATVAQHFAQNWGITFHHIDPLNEPGQNWWTAGDAKQEGCGFNQSEQATMIQSLATALANKGLSATGISAMDEFLEGTGNWSSSTAAAELYNYDGTTQGDFGRINTHGYSSPAGSVALYNEGMLWGKAVTMSEWGSSDKTGKDISNQIMADIDQSHVVAFSIWQPDYPSLLTIDYTNQSYTMNEAYYAYANFSRFIRPGYRFIAISDSNSVAAFNEQTHTLVIVTKNWNSTNQSNTYNLNNFSSLGSSVSVYRTSATENLASVTGAKISSGSFTYTANANSVSTFVISGATYAPSATTINDNTTGTGLNQFNYVGSWGYYNTQTGAYNNDNHWSGNTNDYYSVQFSGTQARLYASMSPNSGILAFSVDGGAETYFDEYAATRSDNVFLFATPTLANTTHTLKVRVTGLKNPASTNYYVAADRIDIVGASTELGQGIYRIDVSSSSSVGANQDLEVNSGSLADGGTVDITADSGATYQRWNVIAVGNGSYRIVNLNSGLDLEDPGYANTNGSKVDQWEDGGAASWNEYWWFTKQTDGTYRISNAASSLDLEVNGTTGAVDQWQDAPGANNEHWQLIPVSQ
ncbi:MAG TPA: glycoside hydrolase [Terriglobales bacterium]|nr:glycoside hydrolase [Terriglobales bacterium]